MPSTKKRPLTARLRSKSRSRSTDGSAARLRSKSRSKSTDGSAARLRSKSRSRSTARSTARSPLAYKRNARSPSTATEVDASDDEEEEEETLSNLFRKFKELPEHEQLMDSDLIRKIKKIQEEDLERRMKSHKGEIPATVIVNRNGDILYIEDGDTCREANTKDSDYANFYLNPNCTGLSYYKSGTIRFTPLKI